MHEGIDLKLRGLIGEEKEADEADGKTKDENGRQHLGI